MPKWYIREPKKSTDRLISLLDDQTSSFPRYQVHFNIWWPVFYMFDNLVLKNQCQLNVQWLACFGMFDNSLLRISVSTSIELIVLLTNWFFCRLNGELDLGRWIGNPHNSRSPILINVVCFGLSLYWSSLSAVARGSPHPRDLGSYPIAIPTKLPHHEPWRSSRLWCGHFNTTRVVNNILSTAYFWPHNLPIRLSSFASLHTLLPPPHPLYTKKQHTQKITKKRYLHIL